MPTTTDNNPRYRIRMPRLGRGRHVDDYRSKIMAEAESMLRPLGTLSTALDYGSGIGWFTREMQARGLVRTIVPVDVQGREDPIVEPRIYDGFRLPFGDREFSLVYAIDVLHHCPDPRESMRDALRCADQYFLLKDHTYRTPIGFTALAVMDLAGNRRFGVESPLHYQRGWRWLEWISDEGFELVTLLHPAHMHAGWQVPANRLQFVGLWHRQS